jgi:hypothetical protein
LIPTIPLGTIYRRAKSTHVGRSVIYAAYHMHIVVVPGRRLKRRSGARSSKPNERRVSKIFRSSSQHGHGDGDVRTYRCGKSKSETVVQHSNIGRQIFYCIKPDGRGPKKKPLVFTFDTYQVINISMPSPYLHLNLFLAIEKKTRKILLQQKLKKEPRSNRLTLPSIFDLGRDFARNAYHWPRDSDFARTGVDLTRN